MNVKKFGFTKGRSTTETGAELIQQIFGAWEDSRDVIGVFCDLCKAFDCGYHDTLIRKLHHYGVTGRSLRLLESYPTDRIQRVDIDGVVPSIFPWTPKPSTSAIERQNRYMERSAKKELFPQNPIETLTGNYSMEDRNEVSDKEENLPEVQMEIEIKTHEKENTVSDEPKDQSGL
ncbi:hypothetical protein EVAR_90274_1 [Eumeta japonica]|uniref:Reverse transcriptase domain-containing protein n=1 Tax=Eumeta variegata TaxID=151549 RepID=A0A4C1Z879_EUMVA|nr:hypothetical protein EVAR_90274_1 [Eumeta japonica]